jgi:hypothetical protein
LPDNEKCCQQQAKTYGDDQAIKYAVVYAAGEFEEN